jgi:hypothetical protein
MDKWRTLVNTIRTVDFFKKGGEYLEQLVDYCLLKKDPAT